MNTRIKDLGRDRSEAAFKVIKGWGNRRLTEYVATLKGLPVALRTQGLVLTCATLMKRENDGDIADVIAHWLANPQFPFFNEETSKERSRPKNARELLEWAVKADNRDYRAAQREALAFVDQLKTLGEAWDHGQSKERKQ